MRVPFRPALCAALTLSLLAAPALDADADIRTTPHVRALVVADDPELALELLLEPDDHTTLVDVDRIPDSGQVNLIDLHAAEVVATVDVTTDAELATVIAEAVADPTVHLVEPELLHQPLQAPGQSGTGSDPARQWELAAVGADRAHTDGHTGAGVTIAVLDTGTARHDDLDDRLHVGWDAIAREPGGDKTHPDTYSRDHGTMVAGTAAATAGNGIAGRGIAPGATVYPVYASTDTGLISANLALRHIVQLAAAGEAPEVVNMSFGSQSSVPNLLALQLDTLHAAGVVLVASAGNSGLSAAPQASPVAHPHVLGVAATTSTGARAPFSSVGEYVDIAAPGQHLLGLVGTGTAHRLWSGTSAAAPVVAAAAALVVEVTGRPCDGDDVDHIYALLTSAADDLGDPGRDDHFGHGLLNLPAALAAASGVRFDCTPPEPDPGPEPDPAPAPSPSPFVDVNGTTHESAIHRLANAGAIQGFSDGTFRPTSPVTRGQFASMVARTADLAAGPNSARFTDVPVGHTHHPAISRLAVDGTLTGFPDGTFRPQHGLTRAQAASVVARHLDLAGTGRERFRDVAEDHPHADAIGALGDAGVLRGYDDGTFRPDQTVTRGQAATLLLAVLERR